MPADWLAGLYAQITGAAAGSGIAVAHNYKRDTKITSLIRFLTGVWFGTVAPEHVLMWLDWPPTTANLLFTASAIGLVAYLAVQVILADKTKQALQSGTKAVIGKVTGAKE